VPQNQQMHPRKKNTQEQIGNLINYVNGGKMTMKEASAKTNITYDSCTYYYAKYLKDPNHNIPVPRPLQYYTQEKREVFIGYIVNGKMTIKAASKKAKISSSVVKAYYHKYFKVENPNIPVPGHIVTPKFHTRETIKDVLSRCFEKSKCVSQFC
jgi:iron-sulfur cluster repair protein YtfE (RIC family)